jgi:hypothetical protein
MSADENTAAKNIIDFMLKFGNQGFTKLLITNYLYELVLYHLQLQSSNKEADSRLFFYYNPSKRKNYTPKELDKFRNNLRLECSKRAEIIVKELQKAKALDLLEKDPSTDQKFSLLIEQIVKGVLADMAKE